MCNPTMPPGLGDEDFADDLQALMPGSPFDLLLGSTSGALLDLSTVGETITRARVMLSQVSHVHYTFDEPLCISGNIA